MAELAARAGLAKGTLYLYYRTKEEVFLAVALDQLGGWLDALDAVLEPNRPAEGRTPSGPLVRGLEPNRPAEGRTPGDLLVRGHDVPGAQAIPALVEALVETMAERRGLLRLLAILHGVIEQNVELQAVLAFKRAVLARMGATGVRLEARLPFLTPGEGPRLLLRIFAIILGLFPMAEPGPVVARALEAADLAPMRMDFARELSQMVCDLLAGMQATRRRVP